MKKLLFFTALVAFSPVFQGESAVAASVHGISFCSCCSATNDQSCSQPCTGNGVDECPVTVVFDAPEGAETSSLNGISLKELELGSPSRANLERFRLFLEQERRKALGDYRKLLAQYKKHKITAEDLAAGKSKLSEAMVNYNHGIYAYQIASGQRSE